MDEINPTAHESRPMHRSAGAVRDVVHGDREAFEDQNRQMVEVQEYASQPEKPPTNPGSSTGPMTFHNEVL